MCWVFFNKSLRWTKYFNNNNNRSADLIVKKALVKEIYLISNVSNTSLIEDLYTDASCVWKIVSSAI